MKKERQRSINLDVIIKWQSFLKQAGDAAEAGERLNLYNLAKEIGIDASAVFISVKERFLVKGTIKDEYHKGSNYGTNQATVKKLIELVRQHKIDNRKKNAIKIAKEESRLLSEPVRDHQSNSDTEYMPELKNTSERKLEGILKRAFSANQNMNSSGSLFSENEKEFDDKLKIACAIASGAYVCDNESATHFNYLKANDFIVTATNDLYAKLKANK